MYFIRPVSLETTDGITYWPDGIPQSLFDEVLTSLYHDKTGEDSFGKVESQTLKRNFSDGTTQRNHEFARASWSI